MKRSERLEKFAELNAGFENNAGAQLVTAQQLHDKHNLQLQKLQSYRIEYQQQLTAKLAHSHSANSIHDYHKFISSLNHAITQQTDLVRRCAQRVESARANWLLKRQDVTKMNQAAAKLRLHETTRARRTEQRESDEQALNKFARGEHTDYLSL